MSTAGVGAVFFGIVVGWVTYRTLVRRTDAVVLEDIATVIGAVGGAAVVGLYDDKTLFGLYAIGLAVGFFAYLGLFWKLNGPAKTGPVMGGASRTLTIDE